MTSLRQDLSGGRRISTSAPSEESMVMQRDPNAPALATPYGEGYNEGRRDLLYALAHGFQWALDLLATAEKEAQETRPDPIADPELGVKEEPASILPGSLTYIRESDYKPFDPPPASDPLPPVEEDKT